MDFGELLTTALVLFTPLETNGCTGTKCPIPPPSNIDISMQLSTEIEESKMKFKNENRWKNSSQKMKYMKWRTGVFQLNKGRVGLNKWYVCEKCNKKRKTTRPLHAHHIFSWEKFPDKRYTIQNGVVLCKWCHNGFHYKYKFEALENPYLLSEWIGENRRISEYIDKK